MKSILSSPLKLRMVEFRNRIVLSPMCTYSSEDGFATDWHLVHLGSRAIGGAALVITEATSVSPIGRISPYDLGIWKEEHIENLRRITAFIEQSGSVPGIQLAHAGRKASTLNQDFLSPQTGGWQTVAPSALPFNPEMDAPHALTQEEIRQIISEFATAAKRSFKAGFKVVEIHAAHGYLIHEFLSPLSNQRTDAYGGSFENRIRLLLEVIDAVRKVWTDDYPLFVRISATDWVEGGWDLPQSIRLCSLLKEKGVDLIDVSTAGLMPDAQIPVGYGYQLPFAADIRKHSGIMVGAVGLIKNAIQAETILRTGGADLILIGRKLLRDPYFPLHAIEELEDDAPYPLQYQRGK